MKPGDIRTVGDHLNYTRNGQNIHVQRWTVLRLVDYSVTRRGAKLWRVVIGDESLCFTESRLERTTDAGEHKRPPCKHCGTELSGTMRVYCSRTCKAEAESERPKTEHHRAATWPDLIHWLPAEGYTTGPRIRGIC